MIEANDPSQARKELEHIPKKIKELYQNALNQPNGRDIQTPNFIVFGSEQHKSELSADKTVQAILEMCFNVQSTR